MSKTKEESKPVRRLPPAKKDEDVCTKKKPCSNQVVVPFKNLSDFEGTYCYSCMTTLTYKKIKPLKKDEKEAPSATYEQPKVPKPSPKKEEKQEPVQAAAPAPTPAPVTEPALSGIFPMAKAEHVNGMDHMILFHFVTENGEEFPVMVSTDPVKVKAIVEKSDLFRGRMAKIEFMGWENDLPVTPSFKGFQ